MITPRDLRHTYNSLTHAAGLDGKLRAELSGLTHDRITDRVYTHVAPARLREAVERFGEYMASKQAES